MVARPGLCQPVYGCSQEHYASSPCNMLSKSKNMYYHVHKDVQTHPYTYTPIVWCTVNEHTIKSNKLTTYLTTENENWVWEKEVYDGIALHCGLCPYLQITITIIIMSYMYSHLPSSLRSSEMFKSGIRIFTMYLKFNTRFAFRRKSLRREASTSHGLRAGHNSRCITKESVEKHTKQQGYLSVPHLLRYLHRDGRATHLRCVRDDPWLFSVFSRPGTMNLSRQHRCPAKGGQETAKTSLCFRIPPPCPCSVIRKSENNSSPLMRLGDGQNPRTTSERRFECQIVP